MNSKLLSGTTTKSIVLRWSLTSGLVAAVSIWLANPDLSHISVFEFGVVIGIIAAAFGSVAGAIVALLAPHVTVNQRVGRIGILVLGVVIGALVGRIAELTVVHTAWTLVIGAAVGAILGHFQNARQSRRVARPLN